MKISKCRSCCSSKLEGCLNLGKQTLLIDGDLRKPVLNKIFKVRKSIGLTEYLSNVEEKWESIINKTDTSKSIAGHKTVLGRLCPAILVRR